MTTRVLHVLLHGSHAGDVTQDGGGNHTFRYRDEYTADPAATPLSLSMPLGGVTYRKRTVDAFMNGLLPDNDAVRERWARDLDAKSTNAFSLLARMGLDCAGAVQFTELEPAEALARDGELVPLTEADIAARLRRLRGDQSSWVVSGERWSLSGANSKFTLARGVDGRWNEALGAAPSTHIVKPGLTEYRAQALNEYLCLAACAALGVRAARTEFQVFAEEPAVVVTRYDRARGPEGAVRRLHQEDMCQALSVPPTRKYETSRGPTAQMILRLLRDNRAPDEDLYRFVDALVLNYLLGAPDAHAKNYSVLLQGRQVRLAPMYDVASALPYEAERRDHELDKAAMAVNGEKRFGYVTGHDWAAFARGNALDAGRVVDRVRDLAERLPDALATVAAPHPGDLANRLVPRVAAYCTNAVRSLRRGGAYD
ncbi:type II toxin-antitoxin system HipA family toxin [Cellulomonas sp. 179-A 4D5 NHS]|uniref:type II toxin-antitoxin system HipA family toxin n=1 Tax=Cellulomonas sp. 179-A 4D5 NHS TaxID=3142378 RepID=UPI00399F248B